MLIDEGSIALFLLATAGLTFFLQNSELLSRLRNWLIRISPWFFKLLECSFCVGVYSAGLIWGIMFHTTSIFYLPVFIFAGAFFTLFVNNILMESKN